MSSRRQLVALRATLLLFAWLVLQLPFFLADADYGLGFSRGPFTDEGLYSAQVRNALITGHLDLTETDGVLKNPLFSCLTWIVLKTFGDSMTALRVAVTVMSGAVLALIAGQSGAFPKQLRLTILLGFLSYFPFHYGHLALAEVPSTVAIVAAMFLVQRRLEGAGRWTLAASGLLIFLSYGLKVQFAYAAAIPPAAFIIAASMKRLSGMPPSRRPSIDILGSSAIALGLALIYIAVWILPNRDIYSVVTSQVSANSSESTQAIHVIWSNARAILRERGVWPLLVLWLVGAIVVCRQWFASRNEPGGRLAWIEAMAAPSAWILLEMHKLLLTYLPSRYLVSLLIATAVWGATAVNTDGKLFARGRSLIARVGVAMLVAAFGVNSLLYAKTFAGRHHVIHDTQAALAAQRTWSGKLAMGPWAPTLFWGTGAITKPIWHGHYNDRDIIARFDPAALVTEDTQEDSHQALSFDGIVLPPMPSLSVRIREWNIGIYEWPPTIGTGAGR